MVEREPGLNEALFMGLIINLQSTAMIALGKLINPLTQNIERNLDQARFTIDMLGMLEDKTNGNRTEEETRTLRRVLTELRMNYLDEVEKDREEQGTERETKAQEKTSGEKTEDKPNAGKVEGVEGQPTTEKAEKTDETQKTEKAQQTEEKPAAGKAEQTAQQKAKEKAAPETNAKKA
jgi:cell division protein FtsN